MRIPDISFTSVGEVFLIGAICAGVSILFCITIGYSKKFMKHILKNDYIGILLGRALSYRLRTTDYNGACMGMIEGALSEVTKPEAFIL